MLRRHTLHRPGDDLARPVFGLDGGLGLDLANLAGHILARRNLDGSQQLLLGVIAGHRRDALELGDVFLFELRQVGFPLVELRLALAQLPLAGIHLLQLAVHHFLAPLNAFLRPLQLPAPALNLDLSFVDNTRFALLCGQLNAFGLAFGLGHDPFGLGTGTLNQGLGLSLSFLRARSRQKIADRRARNTRQQQDHDGNYHQ